MNICLHLPVPLEQLRRALLRPARLARVRIHLLLVHRVHQMEFRKIPAHLHLPARAHLPAQARRVAVLRE